MKVGPACGNAAQLLPGQDLERPHLVTSIRPSIRTTRTVKVRIEFPNPDFELKPQMFADVQLKVDYGNQIVVPQEAVLDSGKEQTVFVAHEGGYFEPRKITTGAKLDGKVVVLSGLKPGENRRHLRQFPDRFREPAEERHGRDAALRRTAMSARKEKWSRGTWHRRAGAAGGRAGYEFSGHSRAPKSLRLLLAPHQARLRSLPRSAESASTCAVRTAR